jgi:hypothetical protein
MGRRRRSRKTQIGWSATPGTRWARLDRSGFTSCSHGNSPNQRFALRWLPWIGHRILNFQPEAIAPSLIVPVLAAAAIANICQELTTERIAGEATVSVTTKSQLSMIPLTTPPFTRETALAVATTQKIVAKPLRNSIGQGCDQTVILYRVLVQKNVFLSVSPRAHFLEP